MKKDELLYEYSDVLENIKNFVLIKNEDNYLIFNKQKQSYLHVYDNQHHIYLIQIMIKKGAMIVNNIQEVRDPNYIHKVQVWDQKDEKFKLVPITEIDNYR